MKKYYIILLLSTLCCSSCLKDNTVSANSYAYMTTRVNGFWWNAIKVTGNVISTPTDTEVVVTGQAANGQQIQIRIPGYPPQEGPYYVDGTKPSASLVFIKGDTQQLIANQGQIIIQGIAHDSLRGSINIKTTDSTMIDEGTFSVILSH